MSNQLAFFVGVSIVLTLSFNSITASCAAEAPRLIAPTILSTGTAEVTLVGASGINYRIDASENLTNWFEIGTGLAANGQFKVVHSGASNLPAAFYRARVIDVAQPPLAVGLRFDTNITASALLTQSGGNCVLFGASGTRFTLSLATNSIPDSTVVTMTLVTNVVDLPFARGLLAAVRITPTNLNLWGAAALEIQFQTNIERRQVASFSCSETGADFQLAPDRVGTNRITIPVKNAGVFGSSLISAQELTNLTQRQPTAVSASTLAPQKHPLAANPFDCQPAKRAAAEAARKQISASLATKSQVISAQIVAARQNQSATETDDSPSVLSNLADQICAAYSSDIAPRWPEAASNCAFGKMLTQFALGLMRQRALLGGGDDDCPGFESIPFCSMFKNCLEETRECCAAGNTGPVKVAEVFGLLRQQALVGLECVTDAEAQEVIDLCSSNIWTGTFSMKEFGSKIEMVGQQRREDDFDALFTGAVIEAKESNFGASGYTADLRVAGQISLNEFHSVITDTTHPCINGSTSGTYSVQESKLLIATNTEYHVYISTRSDGTYVMFASNMTPTGFGVSGIETTIDLQHSSDCSGAGSGYNRNHVEAGGALARGMPTYQGLLTDPKAISGTLGEIDTQPTPQTRFDFIWNFKRNPAAP